MCMDEHLQASTVAGLIDKYKGASNYLNDRQNPAQATRIFVCRVKCKREHLDLSILSNILAGTDQKAATHIVTRVTYGAEAYCVLSQDLDNETDQDARDEAEEHLSMITSTMEVSLADNQNLTQFRDSFDKEKKQLANRLKCRLYADLQSQPVRECNIYDAYKHFLKLIEQTQKMDGDKAVPISIQLCPLKVFNNQTVPFHRDVDADLTSRCCRIWDELERILARAEAIKKVNRSSLNAFVTAVSKYQDLLRKGFKTSVLKARENSNGDDDEVERVANLAERHPIFQPDRLMQWIQYKQAEVEMATTIANSGITFLANKKQVEKELIDSFNKKYALVLYLPPLDDRTNEILEEIKDYLKTYTKLVVVEAEDEDEEVDKTPWHMVQRKRKQLLETLREFADHVEANRHLERDVQFFVTFGESGQGFGYRYSVYEAGKILKDNINRLPAPPSGLMINRTTKTPKKITILIEWSYKDLGYPYQFVVNYRSKDSPGQPWKQQKTKSGETQTSITFQRDSTLEIKVATETCIGLSAFSEIIDTELCMEDEDEITETYEQVRTEMPSKIGSESSRTVDAAAGLQPPIDIKEELVTQTTAEITWSHSSGDSNSYSYHVKYWPNEQDASLANTLDVEGRGCRLEKLKPETTYLIQVVAVSKDGQQKSEPSKTVTMTTANNKVRFAEMIVKRCKKVNNRNGLDLYAVPLTSGRGATAERFVFGKADDKKGRMQHRTILVMGATGSGKTTLINGMINYIFDVEWDDPFRFQLIQEQIAGRSQIDSQTSKITAYDIHHSEGFRIPYSLTIVDTPGYGDTKGLKRDQEITEMVRQFFEDKDGIQELDVVGFVAPASLPRLTPTQTYIFDSVLAIFGNDIKENINFMLTFADSQIPPILSAIKHAGLPYPTDNETGDPLHHKFNNSGFFCSNGESGGVSNTADRFNRFFWRMGIKNFAKFFNVLATMTTKSLSLTKQVLEERKRLEATVDGLQPLIKIGLSKMEEMRKTKQMIANNQLQIEANTNVQFEIEVTVPQKVEIAEGQYLTNCNKCYVTCHNPCGIPNDDGKVECWAMNFNMPAAIRCCRICPKNCIWYQHANQPYMWEYVNQKQLTSSDDIKRKYEVELNRKLSAQDLVKVLQQDLDNNEQVVLERVDTVSRCIQRLDEIALRPNPFSTPQYIDLIIDAEQQEKKVGFKERIESLEKLRRMAVITTKIRNQENLFDVVLL